MRTTDRRLGLVSAGCTAVLVAGLGASALAADAPGPAAADVPGTGGPAARPDIMVFYLDDVAPHDGRLWSDPARTPALASLFGEGGTTFSSAVVETPLCSPGRAGFLTGRHTSQHGVDRNDVALFDPTVTVGTELQEVGYRTVFVGKYLNQLRSEVRRRDVHDHAAGWDAFDVIYEDNGQYLGYALWTRDGVERMRRRPLDHSTLVSKRRALSHIRQTPPGQPVFAVMSLFDLHAPNRPPRRYRGDRRCRGIEPWSPPNFDVVGPDKPAYVRKRPPIRRRGWPMRRYCEEMLAVDEAVRAVVAVQERRGRLHDTLFVFTADNGVSWGSHRLRQRKSVPYTTPVPLMLRWSARWGDAPRLIDEIVSNIDLAPTLCAVAGCEMGPFPSGQASADGTDLLPLIDGEVSGLERTRVREQSGPDDAWAPEFWALRTTDRHALGRWHYIEYDSGEVELYDPVADPWELENLVDDPAHGDVVTQLSAELREEFPALAGAEAGADG